MRLNRLTEAQIQCHERRRHATVTQVKEEIGRLVYIVRNASPLAYSSFGSPSH